MMLNNVFAAVKLTVSQCAANAKIITATLRAQIYVTVRTAKKAMEI